MSKIYMPSVLAAGFLGYMGLLYASYYIDTKKQRPQVNIINLGDQIPTLNGMDLSPQNQQFNLKEYYRRINYFQRLVQMLSSQKVEVVSDLRSQDKQLRGAKLKQQKSNINRRKNSENHNEFNLLEEFQEHSQTKYYHANKLKFYQSYLSGLVKLNKGLDLQSGCQQIVAKSDVRYQKCVQQANRAENMIRMYLYRNKIGNQ